MSTLTFFRPSFALGHNAWSNCETTVKSRQEVVLNPRVDVIQTDTQVELEFELPGVSKENIDVSVENQILKVKASKANSRDAENTDFRLRERAFGTYERSFRLADHLNAELVQASFNNGVLTLSIPRKESSLARKVDIL